MRLIKFPFSCPCLEEWTIQIPKPKITGLVKQSNCPKCETQFTFKIRPSRTKGKNTDYEVKVVKSLASEKLVRILQVRSMTKLKSPEKWKEELFK